MSWTRRKFIAGGVTAGLAAGCVHRVPQSRMKTVALLGTVVRKFSHAQHFVDRFLEGYGWQGRHHYPAASGVRLASLYVDQFPDDDLARDRGKRHGVPIYPTVEEALTLSGSKLAVDGVVIIGEHGKYPRNEKGQTLYPRYKWFKQVVKIFEQSGRAVPVFNDKHLSTDWRECEEMVADSKRLRFPFMAGSSLPVTWRIPGLELPLCSELNESLSICYGGVDSYDFHGYETAQCMSERRAGGELGVKSVQALRGEKIWERVNEKLLLNALSRSHTLRAREGYTHSVPDMAWIREANPNAIGFFVEHVGGFRTTMLMLNGFIDDFTYAGQTADGVASCQMYLPMPPRYTTLADFFNPLVNHIEHMVLTGKVPYPIERTLLTSGMTLAGVESLHRGQTKIETPQMRVAYEGLRRSAFWSA
ncbi:MAG TPA: hypothetical protein VJ063_17605 [Verrucomicrobiae bacterium]|nr:hypothetical protein [Verrucomicrobiae bacterium]